MSGVVNVHTVHGVYSLEHPIVDEAIAVKVTMDTEHECCLACYNKNSCKDIIALDLPHGGSISVVLNSVTSRKRAPELIFGTATFLATPTEIP